MGKLAVAVFAITAAVLVVVFLVLWRRQAAQPNRSDEPGVTHHLLPRQFAKQFPGAGGEASDDSRTFAYMLLSCQWENDYQPEPHDWTLADVSDWSLSDIVELYSEEEDEAAAPEDLWAWGWDTYMDRVAPVQLVEDWDPRPFLRYALRAMGISSLEEWQEGKIWFVQPEDVAKANLGSGASPEADAGPNPRFPADKQRAAQVLSETLRLAKAQGRGLLFFGEEGWYYGMEVPKKTQPVLRRAGFKFVTRHP